MDIFLYKLCVCVDSEPTKENIQNVRNLQKVFNIKKFFTYIL